MPRYRFALGDSPLHAAAEIHCDDAAAKRHACVVVDEINRNVKSRSRVLVRDDEGELLAAVSPVDD